MDWASVYADGPWDEVAASFEALGNFEAAAVAGTLSGRWLIDAHTVVEADGSGLRRTPSRRWRVQRTDLRCGPGAHQAPCDGADHGDDDRVHSRELPARPANHAGEGRRLQQRVGRLDPRLHRVLVRRAVHGVPAGLGADDDSVAAARRASPGGVLRLAGESCSATSVTVSSTRPGSEISCSPPKARSPTEDEVRAATRTPAASGPRLDRADRLDAVRDGRHRRRTRRRRVDRSGRRRIPFGRRVSRCAGVLAPGVQRGGRRGARRRRPGHAGEVGGQLLARLRASKPTRSTICSRSWAREAEDQPTHRCARGSSIDRRPGGRLRRRRHRCRHGGERGDRARPGSRGDHHRARDEHRPVRSASDDQHVGDRAGDVGSTTPIPRHRHERCGAGIESVAVLQTVSRCDAVPHRGVILDGDPYWAWSGTETAVHLGGSATPTAVGAWVFGEMTWQVSAYDADGAPLAISERRRLSP